MRRRGASVTPGFFDLLGVEPARGRFFTPDEGGLEASPVAVVSHAYWRKRLGADPSVVGRAVPFGSGTYTVVGVAPPDFVDPVWAVIGGPFRMDAPDAWRAMSHRGAGADPSFSATLRRGRGDTSRGGARLRSAFAVAQLALAVILLSGMGLVLRSFLELSGEELGVDARGVLTVGVILDGRVYDTREAQNGLVDELVAALGGSPRFAPPPSSTRCP